MLLATRAGAAAARGSPSPPAPRAAGRADPQPTSATATASQAARDGTMAGSGTPQPTAGLRLVGGPRDGAQAGARDGHELLSLLNLQLQHDRPQIGREGGAADAHRIVPGHLDHRASQIVLARVQLKVGG